MNQPNYAYKRPEPYLSKMNHSEELELGAEVQHSKRQSSFYHPSNFLFLNIPTLVNNASLGLC
jgi:hypothetical protein